MSKSLKPLVFIPYFNVCVRIFNGYEVIPVHGAFEAIQVFCEKLGSENIFILGPSDTGENEELFMRSAAHNEFLSRTGVLKDNVLRLKTGLEDDSMQQYVTEHLEERVVAILYPRFAPLLDLPDNLKLLRVLTSPDSNEVTRYTMFRHNSPSVEKLNQRPHISTIMNWERVADWMRILDLLERSSVQ